MPKRDYPMKLFKVQVTIEDEIEEVPMWASSLDEALEAAELEYGEVHRVRPVVNQEVAP